MSTISIPQIPGITLVGHRASIAHFMERKKEDCLKIINDYGPIGVQHSQWLPKWMVLVCLDGWVMLRTHAKPRYNASAAKVPKLLKQRKRRM